MIEYYQEYGLSTILFYNKLPCDVYYNDREQPLFSTKEGDFIWKKETNQTVKIPTEKMLILLLKIGNVCLVN